MTLSIENNCSPEKIFGSAPKVLKTTTTLMRLVRLDSSLSQRDRQGELDILARAWIAGQKALSITPEEAIKAIDCGLQKLKPRIKKCVESIYRSEQEDAKATGQLDKCMRRFLKDAKSVLISPLVQSHRGLNGPTFLVSYPRLDKTFAHSKLANFVVKWTDWNEICSNLIYKNFSQCFSQNKPSTFLVPNASALDFDVRIHEMADGSHTILTPEITEKLKQKFKQIADLSNPQRTPEDEQVMLSERINGENIIDFVQTKYQYLSQAQKEKLLNRLGRIAMLDVLMGNLDRFIQVHLSGGKYELDDFESNLGNLMVSWSGKSEEFPVIFAIDNGLAPRLIHDSNQKELYLSFLRELFVKPKMGELLSEYMLGSIKRALVNYPDDEETRDRKEIIERLKPFSQDLDSFGQAAFCTGIKEMSVRLRDTLIPAWNSEQTAPLKQHLSWVYPELLQSISERFDAFKLTRK